MKIGMMVETARSCGALGERGGVDLGAETTGKLLGIRGDHCKLELADGKVVYLATEYLKWR